MEIDQELAPTVPVTVITGFLGAGKTTLVNQSLAGVRNGEVVVIVNEHGAVGIDGELLAARGRVLVQINGGCVCCTTQAELVSALDQVAASENPPRRVLIETSGAASPAGVLRAIAACSKRSSLVLDGVVTVFDATYMEACLAEGVALEQLGYADVVLLSRADACSPEEMNRAKDALAARNAVALFFECAHGQVLEPKEATLEQLLDLRKEALPVRRAVRLAPSAHVYDSLSLEHEGELDGERFADFMESELGQFAGRLFRLKGILAVHGVETRMIVQGVADTVDVTFGEPWGSAPRRSRLVVIGYGLDREALSAAFERCALPAAV